MSKEGSVLLLDKPLGWSSFDVVKKLRWAVADRKAGHAGTLDPLATGLLIICTGKKTKEISQFQEMDKEYTGVFLLGKTTPSYDAETEVIEVKNTDHIDHATIEQTCKAFLGTQLQVPPVYSAVMIDGKRAYQLIRKGKEVKLEPKNITINEIEVDCALMPSIKFRVVCSKGTYIRSLVNDIGQKLGCGAYLTELRRTRIGPYKVEEAKTPVEMLEVLKTDAGLS